VTAKGWARYMTPDELTPGEAALAEGRYRPELVPRGHDPGRAREGCLGAARR
jgi:hypothetical protein